MLALEQEWLGSGLPVAALMEAVGQAMADWCLQRRKRLEQGVLVLVGPGHNGGDGLVVARRLLHAGVEVRLWAPLPLRQALTQEHWRHLEWLGATVLETQPDPRDSALWVEALFGLGQHRPLPEGLALLFGERERVQPGRLISLDVPAGMHSNHGQMQVGGGAVASDTLCVGLVKQGLVQDAALANVGRVHRLDPGVPPQLIEQLEPAAVLRCDGKGSGDPAGSSRCANGDEISARPCAVDGRKRELSRRSTPDGIWGHGQWGGKSESCVA